MAGVQKTSAPNTRSAGMSFFLLLLLLFPFVFCQKIHTARRIQGTKKGGKRQMGRGPTCPPYETNPVPPPPSSASKRRKASARNVRRHQRLPRRRRRRLGGDQMRWPGIRRAPIHVSNGKPLIHAVLYPLSPGMLFLEPLTCSRSPQPRDAVRKEHAAGLQDRRRARRQARHRRAQRPLALSGRRLPSSSSDTTGCLSFQPN